MRIDRRTGGPRPATIALLAGLLALPFSLFAQDAPTPGTDPADATAPAPADDAAAPDSPAAPEPADDGPLGPDIPGYEAPATPHPLLNVENELLNDQDERNYKLKRTAFTTAMNDGSLVGQNRKHVSDGLRYLVLKMSMKENRTDLPAARGEVERWIRNAAMKRSVKPAARRTFREFMLDRIIEHSTELLKGNLEVRLQAIILLNECTVLPPDPFKKTPAEFYAPTYKVFLDVLQDEKQHEVIRIWAAKGLRQVLENAPELRNADRDDIAKAMMAVLADTNTSEWLDMRVAEASGSIGIVRFGGGKPRVVEGLCSVLNDSSRSVLVRSECAKQLGRVKFDPNANLSLFAQQTARLVEEMAAERARNPDSAKWRICFLNAYLAFVPVDKEELNAKEAGLLVRIKKAGGNAHAKYVEDAFAKVVPLTSHVIGPTWQAPLKAADVQQLSTWLDGNPPTDLKPTPDLEPLEIKRVAETPPSTAPAG